MDVDSHLREYIVRHYMGGDGAELGIDTPLFELNILDSSAIFDLLEYLRTAHGVRVPIARVTPDNFRSLRAITTLIGRLRSPDVRSSE